MGSRWQPLPAGDGIREGSPSDGAGVLRPHGHSLPTFSYLLSAAWCWLSSTAALPRASFMEPRS